jgi:CheY-like chemotaxis protein
MSELSQRRAGMLCSVHAFVIDPDEVFASTLSDLLLASGAVTTATPSVLEALSLLELADLQPRVAIVGASVPRAECHRFITNLRTQLAIPPRTLPAIVFTHEERLWSSTDGPILCGYQGRLTRRATEDEILGAIRRVCSDAHEEQARYQFVTRWAPGQAAVSGLR